MRNVKEGLLMLQTNLKVVKTLIIQDIKFKNSGLRYTLDRYSSSRIIGEVFDIKEGINFIKKYNTDIVLLNFDFSDIKNEETTLKLKESIEEIKSIKNFEGKCPKILILTSTIEQNKVIWALKAGVSGYCIRQELDVKVLSKVIESVYNGAFWIDPKVSNNAYQSYQKIAELFPYVNDIKLTQREKEVLKYIVEGKSNPEIAKELIVSVHTAKAHVTNILQKMEVKDRVQAAVKAIRCDLI